MPTGYVSSSPRSFEYEPRDGGGDDAVDESTDHARWDSERWPSSIGEPRDVDVREWSTEAVVEVCLETRESSANAEAGMAESELAEGIRAKEGGE